MILLLLYLPPYAAAPVSVVDSVRGWGSYLAIFQDEAETASDRLEGAEGIC